MTGNIIVRQATWATVCGSIEFTTNFTRKHFKLTVAIGEGLMLQDMDRHRDKQEPYSVTRDEVLTIIRQGDDAMWSWPTFLNMWQGWAAGYAAGQRLR